MNDHAQAYYWTIAQRPNRCARCGEKIPPLSTIAFRADDADVVCEICAEREGLEPLVSKRYKKAHPTLFA